MRNTKVPRLAIFAAFNNRRDKPQIRSETLRRIWAGLSRKTAQ
jgi:hypothetical protein